LREGDLIIINGARVSQFGGKSLNCSQEHCKIYINPDEDTIFDDLSLYVDLRRCRAYRGKYEEEELAEQDQKL
jgi:hypothetical protein